MAEIKIMVDYEAEGIWCDEAAWHRIPADLREKLRAWNWWWELGEYHTRQHGNHGPDFDPDACAWIGLGLAMQLQQTMPDDRVIFVHEAEWVRAFAQAQESGQGYDVPGSKYAYEIFSGPDRIEARHIKDE